MNNIKNFNKFVLENVEQPETLVTIRTKILSLRGKNEDSIDEILPGFELDNFEGDDESAYYDLMSPVDKNDETHVVAKLTVKHDKITEVSSMNDDNIEEWLKNKL